MIRDIKLIMKGIMLKVCVLMEYFWINRYERIHCLLCVPAIDISVLTWTSDDSILFM